MRVFAVGEVEREVRFGAGEVGRKPGLAFQVAPDFAEPLGVTPFEDGCDAFHVTPCPPRGW
ncbi:MAG: hypothetical protein ACM3S1_13485 [Hyphomicrobiales bacterium]